MLTAEPASGLTNRRARRQPTINNCAVVWRGVVPLQKSRTLFLFLARPGGLARACPTGASREITRSWRQANLGRRRTAGRPMKAAASEAVEAAAEAAPAESVTERSTLSWQWRLCDGRARIRQAGTPLPLLLLVLYTAAQSFVLFGRY